MARNVATDRYVDRAQVMEFVRPRHQGILTTYRHDGRLQQSPVTMGVDGQDRVVVASYPERAKSRNLRRDRRASILVISDEFNGEWVQLDGTGEVLDLPDALEPLVEYFRVIVGEHSDWDEYRQAMIDQGKVLIRVSVDAWGPISKGGFPARLV